MAESERVDVVVGLVVSVAVVKEAAYAAALGLRLARWINSMHTSDALYPSAVCVDHQDQSVKLPHRVYARYTHVPLTFSRVPDL